MDQTASSDQLAIEAIRQSEARMRALVRASSQSIYRMSPDWSEMLQLEGAGLPAPAGLPSRDWMRTFVHPEDRAYVEETIARAIASRGAVEFEHRLHRADGSQGWIHSRAVPILDERGEITEWFGAASDISARKQAEEQVRFLDMLGRACAAVGEPDELLAISTRMLGHHLQLSSCAYADMDEDEDGFTIRGDWHAPGSQSIRGRYRLKDFGTLAVRELSAGRPLIIRDNLREIEPHEAATFQAIGISATICMPLVKNGRLTALMAIHAKSARNWTDAELSLLTEVTERCWAHIERVRAQAEIREAERLFREELERKVEERTAALAQSEKNIRTIFETSHLYQGLLDSHGRLLHANSTALKGIGCGLGDIKGQLFWETPWFADTAGMADLVRGFVSRAAAGETIVQGLELILPIGERSFDFSLRPVRDGAGEVIGIVAEGVDTTGRIVTERALQQAQKMEAIGNLTGGVAHDFNNLLMAISGSLELLRRRLPADPQLARLIDNAMEGVRRGSSLTQRMLAFARRQDLKMQHVEVRGLIEGMRELLARALGPMVTLDIVAEPGLAVIIDPVQLESAILNLAVNARDAMGHAGALLIRLERSPADLLPPQLKPAEHVCLSVTDTGNGMDRETLKRATEPFFTTKGVGKGTGLGLSMIQGLAEQAGGALVLKSRPGEGTRAEIWLPLALNETQPSVHAPASPQDPHLRPVPASARRHRILVVDDDPLVLMNTVDMLEDLGHEVISCTSGQEALALVGTWSPSLVVTDHAMPHMTGTELISRIREILPDLPILIATGYADLPEGPSRDIPRLSKPFSQEALAIVIAEASEWSRR